MCYFSSECNGVQDDSARYADKGFAVHGKGDGIVRQAELIDLSEWQAVAVGRRRASEKGKAGIRKTPPLQQGKTERDGNEVKRFT